MGVSNFSVNTSKLSGAIRKMISEQPQLVEKAMRDCSQMMLKGARDRAPKDEGILANSIQADVVDNAKSKSARVFVPLNAPASAYAIPMHEWLYNLGRKSLAKQAKVGVVVGAGYLSRAVSEQFSRLVKCIEFVFKKNLK